MCIILVEMERMIGFSDQTAFQSHQSDSKNNDIFGPNTIHIATNISQII